MNNNKGLIGAIILAAIILGVAFVIGCSILGDRLASGIVTGFTNLASFMR